MSIVDIAWISPPAAQLVEHWTVIEEAETLRGTSCCASASLNALGTTGPTGGFPYPQDHANTHPRDGQ